MRTEFETLIVKVDGPICEVILNRPEARNAWNAQMHADYDHALDEAADDASIKVVTLRGAGKIFSAGHDLKEVAEGYSTIGKPSGWDPHRSPQLHHSWYFHKPIIAGVHEYCGPIATRTLACVDFVIAADGTRFSFEQTRRGGGNVVIDPLPMMLPLRVWKKLYMMGGWMDADQALSLHFVQRVVPRQELDAEVRRWAEQIALIPTRQVQVAKQGIHRQYELMGLANMALVQNQITGHGSDEDKAWFQNVLDKGLKAALKERDSVFDQDIAKI
jgi:enoyl-CoA hydratase/carnithine racemase